MPLMVPLLYLFDSVFEIKVRCFVVLVPQRGVSVHSTVLKNCGKLISSHITSLWCLSTLENMRNRRASSQYKNTLNEFKRD